MFSVLAVLAATQVLRGGGQVSPQELVIGYDHNSTSIRDLAVTYTFRSTVTREGREMDQKSLLRTKEWYEMVAREQGTPEFLLDEQGRPPDFASLSEDALRARFQMAEALKDWVESHRYMEKAPGLRSFENGVVSEQGALSSEYRVAFDGNRYKTLSPAHRRGSVIDSFDFDAVDRPHNFVNRFWRHGFQWPDFARAAQVVSRQVEQGSVPTPSETVEVKGMSRRDGHDLYEVSYSVSRPDWLSTLEVEVDAQRGFQAVGAVYEERMRLRPEEDAYPVVRRIVLDNVKLASDPARNAWLVTDARLRFFARDTHHNWEEDKKHRPITFSLAPEFTYTHAIELITHDIRVNQGLADEAFKIEFPRGYMVYDSLKGEGFIVGGQSTDDLIKQAAAELKAIRDGKAPPQSP